MKESVGTLEQIRLLIRDVLSEDEIVKTVTLVGLQRAS
jgi:hypothetical protein